MGSETVERVRSVVTAPVSALGADLEDVQIVTAAGRAIVRVIVDTDTGITLDEVSEVNAAVGRALEVAGVMGSEPYVLEVSSPGVARPLTLPRHWRRNRGRLVRVRRRGGLGAITGRIVSVGDDAAVLDDSGTETAVSFDDVERAVVQVEFTRPQKGQ
jgi:ribosome maturation factor RimP